MYTDSQVCVGKNQEWTSCGTACPLTCGKPPPEACTLQCVIGCQCKEGYWLKNGECVSKDECGTVFSFLNSVASMHVLMHIPMFMYLRMHRHRPASLW